MTAKIVTPWHNTKQRDAFSEAWGIWGHEPRIIMQQDKDASGCAVTKNRGIQAAIEKGAEVVIVLDDDCFPTGDAPTLDALIDKHIAQLEKTHEIEMCVEVTRPASRGTPYQTRAIPMKAAASMGFWTQVGDYDAIGQLAYGATNPMDFEQAAIHGKYFPLCGMNLAFRADAWPWCQFIDVPRFDDIWQGWLWQRHAYDNGMCFSLNGPLVRHSRQSNVWQNLRDEALNIERNETLWRDIATAPAGYTYESLKALI
jgi:hypothetical protein